ncbi:MAG: cob(I)yrinic acid a,c-diamide adenosyltransferase [Chitinophagaceae bacterium]|nr:cob(I)yrinic acid a,c-diamide adenosyltransferase [Chitinophagaceae bacterium]
MAIKIYTKTGDKGSTSLIGGTKVSKSHLRIETYGTVDELNAHIGLCRDMLTDNNSRNTLQKIQNDLFVIGSLLACDPEKDVKMALPEITESDIFFLEKEIDQMDAILPAMKYFILPGGNIAISQLHIARCICRRAERCCMRLDETSAVNPLVLKYLNRLSDYLFVLARYTGHLNNIEDIPWVPQKIDK